MKKLLSVLLSTAMIITSLFAMPTSAMAASGSCGAEANYTYDLTKGTLVISGKGAMKDYSVSENAPWFNADCQNNIKSITISSGIDAIGNCAFRQLRNVSEITIAGTVKIIGDRAFESCAVGAVPITLTIPSSVEKIGFKAFRDMSKLAKFSVSENNKYYKSIEGVLYNKACSELIQVPSRLDKTALTLPETVTAISEDAFYKVYNVTDVYVPAGVNKVGNDKTSVFGSSNVKTVHYPKGSAFDWKIYLQNLPNISIEGVCYNQNACEDDISNYSEKIVPAGCTEQGYTIHTCGKCGYSYMDNYTEPNGHSYDEGRVTQKAVCNKAGVKTYTCQKCDSHYTEPIPALTHKYATTKAVIGKNGSVKCSLCNNLKTTIYAPKTLTLSTTSYTYNGKAKTPSVTVKDSKGKTLVKNTDYTVTYQSGRTKIGKYKVTVTFKGNYSGKKDLYFTINPKISLSATTYTYNGNAKKPTVTVKDANGKKLSSSNYTVNYASGRKNVGKYKVTIKFKNGHSGTYTKEFTIKPAKTSLSSLTAAKKAITVKWKKKTTQVTGYQIQYSTSSSFKSAKTVTISKNSTTSKKLTGLSANKKYYVRIRTYKTVNGTKYYSDWSSAKSIKTK